jgi:hypothetical protein
MKNNLIKVIALSICFAFQLSAHNPPEIKETSPLYIKKNKVNKSSADAGERTSKQVIKLNLSQLALRNISLQYEYGFHKNMSGALGISYLMPLKIPSVVFEPSANGEGYQLPKFSGWSVTPEFRFYPGKKEAHQAPHGFYLAPYMRYSKYTLSADYYDLLSNGNMRLYKASASFSGITGGLMIGSQWIIGKHFSIDWWIIGGGVGKGKLTLESKSDDPTLNLSAQEQADLKTDINTNIGELQNFSNGTINIETTSNSAKATIKGIPMTSYRAFGLNLGFAF